MFRSLFNMLTVLLAVSLAISVNASAVTSAPTINTTDPELLRQIRGLFQKVRDEGCDINLCFALQGDNYITDAEFEAQKNFVDLILAIVTTDEGGNYCAVQYGSTTGKIQRLTGNKEKFLESLRNTERVGGYKTNLAAALGYAGFQIRTRQKDVKKIIVLGDGLENVGFGPKSIADKIRKEGIDISAVAVGEYKSIQDLKRIVGGDRNKVMQIDDFFNLAEIIVSLVFNVCGFFP